MSARPTPEDLGGNAEAAEILGVSTQRVTQLARTNPAFPKPLRKCAMGPIYYLPDVVAFAQTWERRPGNPAWRSGDDGPGGAVRVTEVAGPRGVQGWGSDF